MADDEDNEHIPLVDELVAKLPQRDGKPYPSCFVLKHPDQNHCRGFADLLTRVVEGELWHIQPADERRLKIKDRSGSIASL